MKRIFLSLLVICASYTMVAQQKDFSDYLSHCRKEVLPFEFRMDAVKKYFPSIGTQGSALSEDYVHKFICMPEKPCDDDPYVYRYDYGVYTKVEDFLVVFLNKLCYECSTDFGPSSAETQMLVYTPEGKLVSTIPILKESDQHFSYSKVTKYSIPNCILSVETLQGTVLNKIAQTDLYKAVVDTFTYTINNRGIIFRKRIGTEKVKTKLSLEPRYEMKVVEKGW